MTTRFSIADLSDMLKMPVDLVRQAVDTLSQTGQLTAESFVFDERNWRISPSDVKRVQAWIQDGLQAGTLSPEKPKRVVKRKQVVHSEDGEDAARPR